jgi:Ni,Fe-hydrogenase I cytochrome b subunit
MAEHKHGEMDTQEQEKTFNGFLRMSAWVAGLSILLLIFIAIVNG